MSLTDQPRNSTDLKRWGAMLCVLTLGVLLLAQGFHTHMEAQTDFARTHCPVCVVAHSTTAIAVAQVLLFVPSADFALCAHFVDPYPKSPSARLNLFIRPPPLN